jgi:hypothetical protein
MDLKETGWEDLGSIYLQGFSELSDKYSVSIKCREFFDQVRNIWDLKKHFVPCS